MQKIQFHEILKKIMDEIENEKWKKGARLPAINDLAEKYDVGVSTIREVYRSLESKGYVSIQQGRGTFVSYDSSMQFTNVSRATFMRLIKLSQYRTMVEPSFAEVAAKQAYNHEIKLIKESAYKMKALVEKEEYSAAFEEDLRFHKLIVKATQNEYATKMYEDLQNEFRRMRARIKKRGMIEKAVHYHKLIAQSIERRDPYYAKMYMESHIEENSDLAMYELSGVNLNDL